MHQTYKGSMECLIIDDCGTDNSIAIAEQMIDKYEGTILFRIIHHEHNRGLSAARNTGTLNAVGDYLYYLDSDDALSDNCIELMMDKMIQYPELEMVQGNAIRLLTSDKKEIQVKHISISFAINNDEVRKCAYVLRQMTLAVWNKLIRRDFIINNQLFCKEGIVSEDYLWTFYLVKHLERVYFIDDITYHYKIRPDSIVVATPRKLKGVSFGIIYHDILMNLSHNREKAEFDYFASRIGFAYARYVHNVPVFRDVFKDCWEKSKLYGNNIFRLKMTICYVLGEVRNGWYILIMIDLLIHPCRTSKKIRRHLLKKKMLY